MTDTADLERRLTSLSPEKLALAAKQTAPAARLAMMEPIAIIGAGCRFPGGAASPEAYWALLREGRDCIGDVPPDRFSVDDYYDAEAGKPGKIYTRQGGFIDSPRHFDAAFFNISHREACNLDPQHRLLLEVSWEALEHAGIDPASLKGSPTGVFVGLCGHDYTQVLLARGRAEIDAYLGIGSYHSVGAGRISYALGFKGPCMAIDAACASSLVTVHLACQSLRTGECDLALAGGANRILTPEFTVSFCKGHLLARDGRCKAFDARADGFGRAEGGGVVVLKRLSDALAAGDPILALIRGSAVNQDGATSSLTAPSGPAQQSVIRAALAAGGVQPHQISYVEAHGTGTPLGDPIEMGALGAVFGPDRPPERPLKVGSVKTNLGHLEGAAGIAGLIKVMLALRHGEIPAHLHLETPNPHIQWERLPIEIPRALTPWPRATGRRLAGVSAFGLNGSNAHVVLEEAPHRTLAGTGSQAAARPVHLLCLSAKSAAALDQLARGYDAYLGEHPDVDLSEVTATANAGRSHFAHRLAVCGRSAAALQAQLAAFAAKQPGAAHVRGSAIRSPSLAYAFTGGGRFYVGMGWQLYQTQPIFRTALDECLEALAPRLPESRAALFPPELAAASHELAHDPDLSPADLGRRFGTAEHPLLAQPRYHQPLVVAVQLALARLWRAFGAEPEAVFGHGVGEYAAACVAGVLTVEQTLALVASRGDLCQRSGPDQVSLLIQAPPETVSRALDRAGAGGYVSGILGPASTIATGSTPEMERLASDLASAGVASASTQLLQGLHPSQAGGPSPSEPLAGARLAAAQLELIGGSASGPAPDDASAADYWEQAPLRPRQIGRGLARLRQLGCDLVLQIGPADAPELWPAAVDGRDTPTVISTLDGVRSDWVASTDVLAQLYAAGCPLRWQQVEGPSRKGPRITLDLPTYPFAKTIHWLDPLPATDGPASQPRSVEPLHPLVHENRSTRQGQAYRTELTGDEHFLAGHRVRGRKILPAVVYLEAARAAGSLAPGGQPVTRLSACRWLEPLVAGGDRITVEIALTPGTDGGTSFTVASDPAGARTVHATGHLHFEAVESPAAVAVEPIKARLVQRLSGPDCYRLFEGLGIEYGPELRGVREILFDGNELLATVEQPPGEADRRAGFWLPPGLTDSVLHCLVPLLAAAPGQRRLYLPVGIDEMVLHRPLSARLMVHGRIEDRTPADGRRFNFQVMDHAGEVLMTVRGLRLQAPAAAEPPPPGWQWARSVCSLEPAWVRSPLPPPVLATARPRTLILDRDPELGLRLAQRWPAARDVDRDTILVTPGAELHIEGAHATVRPGHWPDVEQLVRTLADGGWHPELVLHRWSLPPAHGGPEPDLADALALGPGTLFCLAKALLADGRTGDCRLLVQRSAQASRGAAVTAGLGGMFRSIAAENPRLRCALVEVEHLGAGARNALDGWLEITLAELAQAAGGSDRIRWLDGQTRCVRRFQATELPPADEAGAEIAGRLRRGGVYLITGGAGGVGRLFAQFLSRRYQAKVMLVGRSQLDAERRAELAAMAGESGEVAYHAADVTSRAELAAALDRTRQQLGPLNGVIHGAAVINDRFLVHKTPAEFAQVLAPKVAGTALLDELTADDPLDLFVLFSSLAAELGNVGQADYAYANGFMDAYTEARAELVEAGRRRGFSLAIAWPALPVGLSVGEETARRLHRVTGMDMLRPAQVLAAFRRGLEQASHRWLVFGGNKDAVLAALDGDGTDGRIKPAQPASNQGVAAGGADARARMTELLLDTLAEVTKVPRDELSGDATWDRYSFDSIMMLDFVGQLEKLLGPLPKTLLFEHLGVTELASHLLASHGDRLAAVPVPSGEPALTRRAGVEVTSDKSEGPVAAAEPIAVVGLSGRYPQAPDLVAFWDNLTRGRDCISQIPLDRWDPAHAFEPNGSGAPEVCGKWGGFLDGVDQFDPLFFSISPREAELMDPNDRLFLQTAWAALEDAGYTRRRIAEQMAGRLGVFVGVMWSEYRLYGLGRDGRSRVGLGGSPAGIANRVSYLLGVRGPSLAIDTMCSSSLTSLHLACESIRRGECDAAIAGGVNLSIHPMKYLQMAQGNFGASDGRCRSFGEGGDGYVPGEGVGAVMLRRLREAERDGDVIHGVIRGSAVNHGGRTSGFTVPNPRAQNQVIRAALQQSGVPPQSLTYIEAHGTGTSLGDPIEIRGLSEAFSEVRGDGVVRTIGSVKSSIGHLEAASGIAALTKVLLQFKHRALVPSLHADKLNPDIDFASCPFQVQTALAAWEPAGRDAGAPLRAGISSFGAGGANAHVIVEEHRASVEQPAGLRTAALHAIPLSAKTPDRLRAMVRQWLAQLAGADATAGAADLAQIAYTAQTGRESFEERVCFLCRTLAELRSLMTGYFDGAPSGSGAVPNVLTAPDLDLRARSCGPVVELAERWAGGSDLDWNELYPDERPRRVSLPTYPFAPERYWVPVPDARSDASKLDPLVHVNRSTLRQQRYETVLSGREAYLEDHQVLRRRTLPAAIYLELARRVGQMAAEGQDVVEIRDVRWLRPLEVDTAAVTVDTTLRQDGAASLVLTVCSGVGAAAVVHCQGRLRLAGGAAPPPPIPLDLPEIRRRLPVRKQVAGAYGDFARMGVQYGPTFRVITSLDHSDGEVLGELRLPEGAALAGDAAALRPSLIDGAFQCLGALLLGDGPKQTLHLPFGLDVLTIHRPVPDVCVAYGRRVDDHRQAVDAELKVFDLWLAGPDGQVAVTLTGFTVKAIGAGSTASQGPALLTAPGSDGKAGAMACIRDLLAEQLKLPHQRIKESSTWDAFGIDSVMTLTLTSALEQQLGTLPKTLFFQYPNVGSLAEHLAQQFPQQWKEGEGQRDDTRPALEVRAPSQLAPAEPVVAPLDVTRLDTAPLDIAIVGLNGRYPMSPDLATYWRNLASGTDCISEIPASRWDWRLDYDRERRAPGSSHSKWGGFLVDVDHFDPLFFNISPREAAMMDPQERLFLEAAWQTLEDAGYTRQSVGALGDVGVFVGVMYQEYQLYGAEEYVKGHPVALSGSSGTIANRISHCLNLGGPSVAVDTMCSSSSTAIHLACQNLALGVCQVALAGGVNLSLHPNKYRLLSHGKFLARDGRCRSFGADGDGYVPGEGVGCLMLRPLAAATRDGDHIYGVIKGSAIGHGGATNGYTVPNPTAQKQVIERALRQAGIPGQAVSYVETHGTGTPLGDPIELTALGQALDAGQTRRDPCAIGSVKSNIGHCESASGIAGLTKVLLQMRQGLLAPSLHSRTLNPNCDFTNNRFTVQQSLAPWPQPVIETGGRAVVYPRIAGVSSFGAGGSNAHIIVSEHVPAGADPAAPGGQPTRPVCVPLSARSDAQLGTVTRQLLTFINGDGPTRAVAHAPARDVALEQDLTRRILSQLAALLYVDVATLSGELPFSDYGLDPVQTMALHQKLSDALDREIPTPWFRERLTANDLARQVAEQLFAQEPRAAVEPPPDRTTRPSLADLAYTLQVGRESHEHRLALVVSSYAELDAALTAFCAGAAIPGEAYQGSGGHDADQMLASDQLERITSECLGSRDIGKLARLWSQGAEVAWSRLYRGTRPRRVSLPTYPFARRRCWFEQSELAPPGRRLRSPLIHENTSTLGAQTFASRFSGRELFFEDHEVRGQKLLPGAALIEIAVAAVRQAGAEVGSVKNVTWVQPVVVSRRPVELVTTLTAEAGAVRFEVASVAEDGATRRVHATGRALASGAPEGRLDIAGIRERGCRTTHDEFYAAFARMGFAYGPSFRCVQEVFTDGEEALAVIALPAHLQADHPSYCLHPALLDAAFQAALTLMGQAGAEGQERQFLPHSLQHLAVGGELPPTLLAHVHHQRWLADRALVTYDVDLTDPTGAIVASLRGFALRSVVPAALAQGAGGQVHAERREPAAAAPALSDHEICYIRPEWLAQPRRSGAAPGAAASALTLLVAAGDPSLARALSERRSGARIVALPEMWLDGAASVEQGFARALSAMQEILGARDAGRRTVVGVFDATDERAGHAPLTGLLCTARFEDPRVATRALLVARPHVDAPWTPDLLAEIEREILAGGDVEPEVKIAWVDGRARREARLWRPFRPEHDASAAAKLRDDGVYWLTGGLGGIGVVFARHLGQCSTRRVVLSGRSALDARGGARLDELLAAGARVQYLRCDVSDPAAVQATFRHIKAEHGALHGIFHGAGVTRDGYLLGKTLDDVRNVFATKVAGTITLDDTTKDEPLDLFVLFSSLAAVNGNLGQADYASANAFMDAYAHHRNRLEGRGLRSGRALSINWPLWRDGGMHVDPQMEALILRKSGFVPISNQDGLEIFETALNGDTNQFAAFRKQGDQAARLLGVTSSAAPAMLNPPAPDPQPPAGASPRAAGVGLVGELTQIFRDLLKLEQGELDGDVNVTEYGVDSIQMMTLLNILEERYRTTLDPNTIVMYPTLNQLAAHLAEQGVSAPPVQPVTTAVAPASTSTPGPAVERRGRAPVQGIAVIGYAARFPGAADADRYWRILHDAAPVISTIPRTRWDIQRFYDPRKGQPDKSYSKFGGFLAGIPEFDPAFFKIPTAEAPLMDPQQRVALELTQHLLDHAGYDPDEVRGERTSLFLGAKESTYLQKYRHLVPLDLQKNLLTHSLANMIAGRIANFYDIRGPVLTVDTACSSSLVAIHTAINGLRRGESDLAIAGGVCLMTDASGHVSFSQAQVLSDDDKSRVFDQRAKGFILGEGAGLVMLKRADEALRDGDQIFAVIRGSAVNNDGYTMGLTVPNKDAQKAVIRAALEDARVGADSIGYLEAHGTGTLLGDPIEIRAATEVFQESTAERGFCAVGSVKSNIGHAITAAGVASLLKVVLSLRHQKIPATLNCTDPHPRFGFATSPFFPNLALDDWRPRQGVRRAGISSFGFGGTNAHLIVEELERGVGESRRRERPPTRFKHAAHWLDATELDDGGTVDYRQILNKLSQKQISLDEAVAAAGSNHLD